MDIKKTFGRNLKKLRQSKNLTQNELAKLLKVKYQAISSLECGNNFVTCSNLEQLCKIFNCHPTDFFRDEILKKDTSTSEYILMIDFILQSLDENSLKYIYDICKIFKNKI